MGHSCKLVWAAALGAASLLFSCSRAAEKAVPAASGTPSSTPPSGAVPASATGRTLPSERAEPALRDDVPEKIERANVTMASTTVDGLEMEKISCSGGSGLLGGMVLLGSLAKQKDALHACAPAAETVRVHVEFEGSKTDDVRVGGASSPKVASCVAAAVSKASFGSTGACVMSIKIGKS